RESEREWRRGGAGTSDRSQRRARADDAPLRAPRPEAPERACDVVPGRRQRGGPERGGDVVAVTTATRPVAVIGAGTMGNGIAQVFAAAGRQVYLVDRDEGALRSEEHTSELQSPYDI